MTGSEATTKFLPCDSAEDLVAFAESFLDGTSGQVPFLAAGRPDLRTSAMMSEEVYGEVVRPEPADWGVDLLDDSPEANSIRILLRPLARNWTTDPAAGPDSGSLLVCGCFQDLPSGILAPLMGYCAPRSRFSVLSGRDLASLSWLTAKQYVKVRPEISTQALLTSDGSIDATEHVDVLSHEDFETRDIRGYLTGSVWRRLKFQSHSKDDLLHLGDWGLCGLSDVEAPEGPVTLKPRCGYRYPCPKEQQKLIRFTEFKVAEVILSGCHSGPFVDAGSYGVRYQLVLAAIDGTAQTVVGTVTASDAGRPESLLFLDHHASGDDFAAVLNAGLADVDPYACFLRYGIAREIGGAETAGTVASRDHDEQHETDTLLSTALDRAMAWVQSDLLPPAHPLMPAFAKFLRKYLRLLSRTSALQPSNLRTELTRDLGTLDRAIAARIIADPSDPMMDYSSYWADRSSVRRPAVQVACSACGDIAQKFTRAGKSRIIPDVEVIVCVRCGDGYFRFDQGPDLTTASPVQVRRGESITADVRITLAHTGTVHYGLITPRYLTDYTLDVPLRSAFVDAPSERSDGFTLKLGTTIIPQIYYYTLFAVQDLSISIARHNFGIVPDSPG